MKNLKLKTLFLALLFLALPFVSHAAVSQLVFTTDSQTVAVGAISDKLTVSSGEAPGETSDLTLVSSSATGEFLSESGVAVRPTWNSNWANRTFYYRDSIAGVYTITATLKTRAGQESWSATQTITVGAGAPGTDNGDTGDTNATTTAPTTPTPTGGNQLSAHESPVPVSQVTASEPFKVGAGRPRLASVHSPIIFRAETTDLLDGGTVHYQWSFGDGGSAVGEQVTHLYYFPGEYNVVLNASTRAGQEAVARTNVSVIQPAISFGSLQPDRVEIINRSPRELNLGGWRMTQGATVFTFPADTIVALGKGTTVPAVYLGFSPISSVPLTLTFPDATVALASTPSPDQKSLAIMVESLRQLSAKLTAIKMTQRRNFPAVQTVQPIPVIVPVFPTTTTSQLLTPTILPSSTAPVALVPNRVETSIPVPKPPGFFTRIKQWFGK